MLKRTHSQRLGENVANLILGGEKTNLNFTVGNMLTNKVKIKLDMLGASMEDGIMGHVNGDEVVTPQGGRS